MQPADGKIGVLALQGDFSAHMEKIKALDFEPLAIRYPKDLTHCQALILPGGESTVILRQAERVGLLEPLRDFAKSHPLFGTCAGLIVMATLGILNVTIERNAYGRQIDSFIEEISFRNISCPAVFIRAPIIRSVEKEVEILASHQGHPVLIQQQRHFGATFHPELTDDLTILTYILRQTSSHCYRPSPLLL